MSDTKKEGKKASSRLLGMKAIKSYYHEDEKYVLIC